VKDKYIQTRIEQCKLLSKQSTCPRRKIAAMLVDPETNSIVADGYNGPPRGAGELCGGDHCNRDTQSIKSGTSLEVGCHHAELNCILNAARTGNSTAGKVLIVTAEPCLMCAKAIHHAGIKAVYIVKGGYSGAIKNGVSYLQENKMETIFYVSSSCHH
jgi:dCMP deaminase